MILPNKGGELSGTMDADDDVVTNALHVLTDRLESLGTRGGELEAFIVSTTTQHHLNVPVVSTPVRNFVVLRKIDHG